MIDFFRSDCPSTDGVSSTPGQFVEPQVENLQIADVLAFQRDTVRRFPDNVVARNVLAQALREAKRLDEAIAFQRETVERFPNDVVARNVIVALLQEARGAAERRPAIAVSGANQNVENVMHAIKVFISHSAKDTVLAKAFVECVEACVEVPDKGLRCTSVPGYKLTPGDLGDEVLLENLENCSVVIGLLTDESLKSGYVAMELGAAWGLASSSNACPVHFLDDTR